MQTQKEKIDAWLQWLETYTPQKFIEAFLRNVENTESVCQYCGENIYVDVLIGGGVADWSTERGDFGCYNSPETTDDHCGSHMPIKRK